MNADDLNETWAHAVLSACTACLMRTGPCRFEPWCDLRCMVLAVLPNAYAKEQPRAAPSKQLK